MTFLIEAFWLPLSLAAIMGFVIGWADNGPRISNAVLALVALSMVAATVAVLLAVVPGRAGLWLETAVMMLAGYLIGYMASRVIEPFVLARSRATPPEEHAGDSLPG